MDPSDPEPGGRRSSGWNRRSRTRRAHDSRAGQQARDPSRDVRHAENGRHAAEDLAILGLCFGCLGIAASTLFARTWTASLVAIGVAFGLGLFTLSFFVALDGFTNWRDDAKMVLLRSILSFNPGYGLFLFFAGDMPELGLRAFWEHYAALMALAGLSFAFAARRLARE